MGCSVGLKYAKNALAAPAPEPLVGWGGGHPLPIPYPLGAFGVYSRAFGASILVPPVEAWCPAALQLATVLTKPPSLKIFELFRQEKAYSGALLCMMGVTAG